MFPKRLSSMLYELKVLDAGTDNYLTRFAFAFLFVLTFVFLGGIGLCFAGSTTADWPVPRVEAKFVVQRTGDDQSLGHEPLFPNRRKINGCRARTKVRWTRAENALERQELYDKTVREIDAIVAEFHARLPRERAKAIGSIYARYSSRFQKSIGDQVRTLFEEAFEWGIFISREHVFFDMAMRGYKDRRPSLTALRAVLKAKKCDIFMVFATSRLYRRAYKAQQFAEEDLVENGIRGIFLHPLIDMASENWRIVFQVLCAMDENTVRTIGAHVRASHEGLFIRGRVCTSLPVGYAGEIVEGEFTRRKLPSRRIVIDQEAAPWILKLYDWYVVKGVPIDAAPGAGEERRAQPEERRSEVAPAGCFGVISLPRAWPAGYGQWRGSEGHDLPSLPSGQSGSATIVYAAEPGDGSDAALSDAGGTDPC